MKRSHLNRLPLLLLVMNLFHQHVAAEPVRLMTEEFAPFQYFEDGKLTGISVEIVRALQKEIGSLDSIAVYPWSRGLRLLGRTRNNALFSTARTPERESKYKWVGPLSELRIVFFKKKGNPIDLKSVEEAKRLAKVGVTKNVAAHELLLGLGFTNLDVLESGADEMNIRKLLRGRIDVWPSSYFAGMYSARKMGLEGEIEAIHGVDIMLGQLYMAFNKETDDSVIEKWQSGLDKLRAAGVTDKIMSKYQ